MKSTNPKLEQDTTAVVEAIEDVGGPKAAAEVTGRSLRSVYRWQNDRATIGLDAATALIAETDLSLTDIYPEMGQT